MFDRSSPLNFRVRKFIQGLKDPLRVKVYKTVVPLGLDSELSIHPKFIRRFVLLVCCPLLLTLSLVVFSLE